MKTLINLPNPAVYLGSLFVAAGLGLACYLLLRQLMITDTAFFLAAGLVIGHLTGMLLAAGSTNRPGDGQAAEPVSLYVGNVAYKAREDSLRKHFSQYGRVYSVRIMTDRHTQKPRGYAFVEMDQHGAEQAIQHLDESIFFGRPLKVNAAHQQMES